VFGVGTSCLSPQALIDDNMTMNGQEVHIAYLFCQKHVQILKTWFFLKQKSLS